MKTSKTYFYVLFLSLLTPLAVSSCWAVGSGVYQTWSWSIFRLHGMTFDMECVVDFHGVSYMITVFIVSSMVLMYSVFYMPSVSNNSFFVSLLLFIASMLLLAMSKSLFWAILGWDSLGITSFLLILHFKSWNSTKSAMVTFMSNRVGDVFIITSTGLLSISQSSSMCLSLFVLLGATTKSAQFPFSAWLPLAMAAPTPVSSLVHSSTLVTAGVFLLTRFNSVISGLEWLLVLLSTITLIYSGLSAMFEWDLKKIVAFSTLSHLSLMVLMISLGSLYASTLHMVMHATFKSALFMVTGAMISVSADTQDIRLMKFPCGSLAMQSVTYVCLFSMAGLPALSGFYSKELMAQTSLTPYSALHYLVFLTGVLLTSAYSVRMVVSLSKCSPMTISNQHLGITSVCKPPTLMIPVMLMGGSWSSVLVCTSVPLSADFEYVTATSSLILLSLMVGCLVGMAFAKDFTMPLSLRFYNKWAVYSILEGLAALMELVTNSSLCDLEGLNLRVAMLPSLSMNRLVKWESRLVVQGFIPFKLLIAVITTVLLSLW
uniref:NADH:ubiquinone reductase (H(+)-translocating) n=1 Tax=Hoplopleura sp. TaxID=2782173 RepID=A0A7S9A328_9NEOP|nr:NADH dehydrogenase subunit 5 [Hoplopleura sp.]